MFVLVYMCIYVLLCCCFFLLEGIMHSTATVLILLCNFNWIYFLQHLIFDSPRKYGYML
jgi:hypothetical protein